MDPWGRLPLGPFDTPKGHQRQTKSFTKSSILPHSPSRTVVHHLPSLSESWTSESLAQNRSVLGTMLQELRRRIPAAIYGWDCPLLTFIYPDFDDSSERCIHTAAPAAIGAGKGAGAAGRGAELLLTGGLTWLALALAVGGVGPLKKIKKQLPNKLCTVSHENPLGCGLWLKPNSKRL